MTSTYLNSEPQRISNPLRNLYFTRTAVQFFWAVLVLASATTNPTLALALMVLYPLWDVACTVFDLTSAPASDSNSSSKTVQYINIFLGLATAIAIAVGGHSEARFAVAAFGAWAFAAGLLQLVVGIYRRTAIKGQWPMILSGLQSMGAGVAFLLGGLQQKVHVKDLGGYAIFGGIYFLIAAILVGRKKQQSA